MHIAFSFVSVRNELMNSLNRRTIQTLIRTRECPVVLAYQGVCRQALEVRVPCQGNNGGAGFGTVYKSVKDSCLATR